MALKGKTIEEIKEWIKKEKEERHTRMLDYWRTSPPFKDADSIPSIPRVSKEEYDNIIIPNIIRRGGIPKKDLKDGHLYQGSCRNASEALWNAEKQCFIYWRTKFGSTYQEEINHFEDDDGYDLFVPIKEIER